jgi:cell division protein FtsB
MSDWKAAFAAAQRYAIARDEHDEEMMSKVEQFCDALDAELNQLRARVAELEAQVAECEQWPSPRHTSDSTEALRARGFQRINARKKRPLYAASEGNNDEATDTAQPQAGACLGRCAS